MSEDTLALRLIAALSVMAMVVVIIVFLQIFRANTPEEKKAEDDVLLLGYTRIYVRGNPGLVSCPLCFCIIRGADAKSHSNRHDGDQK